MYCLYGKKGSGLCLAYLRKTNGMVAFTPSISDPFWLKYKWVPFYQPKCDAPNTSTFTWMPFVKDRYRLGFG